MKMLRNFGKSENAHLLATFLRDAGIEVSVFDENAYGGNALGAIGNSIRIEVAEAQFEEATRLMDEFYSHRSESSD